MTTQPRLIAAHHIALLLLSTAAPGSKEHVEICRMNDLGIWMALAVDNLVVRAHERGLWCLTERGQVLVEAILALPLPEPIRQWSMPSVTGASTPAPRAAVRLPAGLSPESLGAATPASVADAPRRSRKKAAAPKVQAPSADSSTEDDDGPAPPRAPNPKPIPDVVPIADHVGRLKQAEELLNRGFGLNEVAETLKIEAREVERLFFK